MSDHFDQHGELRMQSGFGAWLKEHQLFAGITVSVPVATVIAVVIATGGANRAEPEPRGDTGMIAASPTPSELDGTKIDIATYPHDGNLALNQPAFEDLPLSAQVDAVAPYINDNIQVWWDIYSARIKLEEKSDRSTIGGADLPELSPNNDAQAIINRGLAITQAEWTASNKNLAKNLVSGETIPNSELYQRSKNLIADNRGYVSPVLVIDELPVFTKGEFAGTQANGVPTKVFRLADFHTGDGFVNVAQLVKGENSGESTWLTVAVEPMYSSSADVQYQQMIDGVLPKPGG